MKRLTYWLTKERSLKCLPVFSLDDKSFIIFSRHLRLVVSPYKWSNLDQDVKPNSFTLFKMIKLNFVYLLFCRFKSHNMPTLAGNRSISEDSIFNPEQKEANVEALRKTAVSMEGINQDFKVCLLRNYTYNLPLFCEKCTMYVHEYQKPKQLSLMLSAWALQELLPFVPVFTPACTVMLHA